MTQLNLGKNSAGADVIVDDTNFGEMAMSRMKQYFDKPFIDGKGRSITITSSKIRNILEMVNKIYNNVLFIPDSELTKNQLSDIAYLKVRMAYECGRDKSVEDFITRSCIMNPITHIVNSRKKDDFLLYCRYVESLLAYFKYYGGRD